MRVVPCRVSEPVCFDESSDPEGLFCFVYSTVFRRLSLRLPFTPFERALLTEVNVAPAQLHPNSWAFVRDIAILCHLLGNMPLVDVFLYFFEAKSLVQKLWFSFNGVVGRVLLTLFQQPTKVSRGTSSSFDATGGTLPSLTGFPSTGRRNLSSRSPSASTTCLHRNGRCGTSSLVFKHRLTRLSCSNLSSALRPLRVIPVLV